MAQIAIIGGGIGGLSTAIALRHYGFETEVFEQAPALLDLGAAIALWPNALRALQHLGIADKILDAAGVMNEIRWLTFEGKTLNRVRIDNAETPAVALHRADLQKILLETVPQSTINLNCSFVGHEEADGIITAKFANEKEVMCKILVGADGIHSDVRAAILDAALPHFRGYMVWRGISPSAPKQFPYDAAVELHGAGKRFGLGPVGHGRVGWWAAANTDEDHWDRGRPRPHGSTRRSADEDVRGSSHNELLELFDGWYEPVLELIKNTPPASVLHTMATDRPSTTTWGRRTITLLGDAIHPTTPNLGQGGCLAIEDAVVLARCLVKYGVGEAALRAYERARYERTAAVAYASRLYGQVGQWHTSLAVTLRSKVFSFLLPSLLRQLMKVVFEYDAPGARI